MVSPFSDYFFFEKKVIENLVAHTNSKKKKQKFFYWHWESNLHSSLFFLKFSFLSWEITWVTFQVNYKPALFFSFDELHQPETAQTRLNIFFNLGFEVLFLWFSPFYKLRLCLEFILSTSNQLNPSGKSTISCIGTIKVNKHSKVLFSGRDCCKKKTKKLF